MKKIAIAFLFVSVFAVAKGKSEIKNDRFISEKWKVSIKIPRHWQATEKTSYPNILIWLAQPKARMLFTAETVDAKLDSQRYAEATLKELTDLGFVTRTPQLHSSTGAFWIDYNNDIRFLRTALLIYKGVGYSLTLAADEPKVRSKLLRSFDSTLRSIKPLRGEKQASPKDLVPQEDVEQDDPPNPKN